MPALDAVHRAGLLCAVFTRPDKPAGRGQAMQGSPVKVRAAELGIPVHQPASFKAPEAQQSLRELNLDALVVVAYGLILPPDALALPRLGCINIHASLLPRWRGAAPIQRALLAGDAQTGVTIMRMEAALDTGPMLAARSLAIAGDDTSKTLHDALAALGAQLIGETLPALAQGALLETVQPAEGVSYAEKISKSEAQIDWRENALQVSRRVHAFNPWPVAQTRFNGQQLRIWEAQAQDGAAQASPGTVLTATQAGIDVACGDGILRIRRLQLPGRKPLAAHEFIQGHRLDGARFGPP